MSKKVLVQQVQPNPGGPVFGQVSNPADFMNAQIFGHAHVEAIARDFVIGSCASTAVAGFVYALPGGMGFQVNGPGHIIDPNGLSYELDVAQAVLTLAPADPSVPRIDLVIATLQVDVAEASELRPFVQLRTQAELAALPQVAPYPPTQLTEPTEQHTIAIISIVQGTPASPPAAAGLVAGQIPLWAIGVGPAVTAIHTTDVSDLRNRVGSLCELQDRIDELAEDMLTKYPPHRHPANQVDIGLGAGIWVGQTVQDYINAQVSAQSGRDPLTMPELWPAHGATYAGGLPGFTPNLDGAIPVVDFDPNQSVVFADGTERKFSPAMFGPSLAGLNPRIINASNPPANQAEDNSISPLTIGLINSLVSDGGGDWTLKSAAAPTPRLNASAAPRDGQFIEVFGGIGPGGNLSDWWTYDTINNTVAARAFTGTNPPACDNPALFTCGDGVHILLGCASSQTNQAVQWFLVNAITGACAAAPGGPTTFTGSSTTQNYQGFIGALVQSGIVLIIAQGPGDDNAGNVPRTMWKYDVVAGAFSLIYTFPAPFSGGASIPNMTIGSLAACLYQSGQLVVFQSGFPGTPWAPGTFIYNYGAATWTQLGIQQPYNPANPAQAIGTGFRLGNFGGKVYMVGGADGNTSGQLYYWRLTPGSVPAWQSFPTVLPWRTQTGLTSTLVGGLPQGAGFLLTGRNPSGQPSPFTSDIWAFGPGGVIQTIWNGQSALTLSPGTTQATFRLTDYQFQHIASAQTVFLHLSGSLPPNSIVISESFDGGINWQVLTPGVITTITHSAGNVRQLQVTLISSGASVPILAGVFEHFEAPGGPGLTGLVLRVNAPPGTQVWWVNRDGSMTVTNAVFPVVPIASGSTPDQAQIVKTTNNGAGVNPTVQGYRNKRRLQWKYTGTRAGGVTPPIQNDLTSTPALVTAWGISGADGHAYKIPDPVFVGDSSIPVTGLTANGDSYIVEVVCGSFIR